MASDCFQADKQGDVGQAWYGLPSYSNIYYTHLNSIEENTHTHTHTHKHGSTQTNKEEKEKNWSMDR